MTVYLDRLIVCLGFQINLFTTKETKTIVKDFSKKERRKGFLFVCFCFTTNKVLGNKPF